MLNLINREMQIKMSVVLFHTHHVVKNIKVWNLPNVGVDVKQQELSCTVSGNVNWYKGIVSIIFCSAVPPLGIYHLEILAHIPQKINRYRMFNCSRVDNNKIQTSLETSQQRADWIRQGIFVYRGISITMKWMMNLSYSYEPVWIPKTCRMKKASHKNTYNVIPVIQT